MIVSCAKGTYIDVKLPANCHKFVLDRFFLSNDFPCPWISVSVIVNNVKISCKNVFLFPVHPLQSFQLLYKINPSFIPFLTWHVAIEINNTKGSISFPETNFIKHGIYPSFEYLWVRRIFRILPSRSDSALSGFPFIVWNIYEEARAEMSQDQKKLASV